MYEQQQYQQQHYPQQQYQQPQYPSQDYESQGYEQPEKIGLGGYNPRLGFVKKVYGILSVQLLFTAFFIYLAGFHLTAFFKSPAAVGIAVFCAVTTFIVCIMITCYTTFARSVPTNYYLLGIFTFCEAYLVAMITTAYTPGSVLLAAALTVSLTLALTLYACTTKTDYTTCGAALFLLAWGLCIFGGIMIWSWSNGGINKHSYLAFQGLGVLIYGAYLIYDTQIIMGGGKYELTLDDYVIGALVLYIDIIVLFLKLLRMFGSRR